MTTEELLKPRYKIIADFPDLVSYPQNRFFKVNQILELRVFENGEKWVTLEYQNHFLSFDDTFFNTYPNLFRPLAWYEERSVEDLQSVKFVKVIKYRGYWREGDVVPIEKYFKGSIEDAKPMGYVLKYNHYQPIFELQPATETTLIH